MILPFVVTFEGDFFSTTVPIELDTDESDIENATAEELDETAIALATNILKFHYGWNVAEMSTTTEVVAG